MLAEEALRALGMKTCLSEDELRAAYTDAVKRSHPDQGGDGDVAKLKRAKDFLMKRFTASTLPVCEPCKGKGVIKGLSKFGTTCKACQGTGRDTRKR